MFGYTAVPKTDVFVTYLLGKEMSSDFLNSYSVILYSNYLFSDHSSAVPFSALTLLVCQSSLLLARLMGQYGLLFCSLASVVCRRL